MCPFSAHGFLFLYICCLTCDLLPILCYIPWAIQGVHDTVPINLYTYDHMLHCLSDMYILSTSTAPSAEENCWPNTELWDIKTVILKTWQKKVPSKLLCMFEITWINYSYLIICHSIVDFKVHAFHKLDSSFHFYSHPVLFCSYFCFQFVFILCHFVSFLLTIHFHPVLQSNGFCFIWSTLSFLLMPPYPSNPCFICVQSDILDHLSFNLFALWEMVYINYMYFIFW